MQLEERDEMIFDLNEPSKKNPKLHEISPIIQLLKFIKANIILLDPIDQESQKSQSVAEFK